LTGPLKKILNSWLNTEMKVLRMKLKKTKMKQKRLKKYLLIHKKMFPGKELSVLV
jgi:hypothetical protein